MTRTLVSTFVIWQYSGRVAIYHVSNGELLEKPRSKSSFSHAFNQGLLNSSFWIEWIMLLLKLLIIFKGSLRIQERIHYLWALPGNLRHWTHSIAICISLILVFITFFNSWFRWRWCTPIGFPLHHRTCPSTGYHGGYGTTWCLCGRWGSG